MKDVCQTTCCPDFQQKDIPSHIGRSPVAQARQSLDLDQKQGASVEYQETFCPKPFCY